MAVLRPRPRLPPVTIEVVMVASLLVSVVPIGTIGDRASPMLPDSRSFLPVSMPPPVVPRRAPDRPFLPGAFAIPAQLRRRNGEGRTASARLGSLWRVRTCRSSFLIQQTGFTGTMCRLPAAELYGMIREGSSICAHEKDNEINVFNTSSGPTSPVA